MGIYVWGTGCGAAELIRRGLALEKITAFVDSFPGAEEFLGRPVLLPEAVPVCDCELLIVAMRHADAVSETCRGLGIPAERCLFLKNSFRLTDRNACSRDTARRLLGEELTAALLPRQHPVPTPDQLRNSRLSDQDLENDYVRPAALELLCRQLAQVPGAAAELGVYRGGFARCINALLPARKLYLFDSFQGFTPEAGAEEAFQAAHENTSAARVLAVLPHPQQAVLKPGFFPDSLNGLEERFCLVSLDVDFEAATLAGLRYFWPRLSSGGYLMLHDWGNPGLPGVAQALEAFQRELGQPIPSVPLPDLGGTLVLCKV